ncbi:MAG: phospholipase D family protein [Thermodesulfovibrionales bacterium]
MDLFTSRTTYLNIVHNDKVFHGDPFSLMSPQDFDELRLITYVSNPEFFSEKIKGFKKVIAILGEEETAREFYQLDPLIEEKFISPVESDSEILQGLDEGKIELRYMKSSERIHSKLYILKNRNGDFRVMIGSANFTSSAFGNRGQFEELIAYDSSYNPLLCGVYLKRFDEIYQNSLDFLSERTRKKIKSLVLKADNILIYTPEDKAELIIEKINNERITVDNASSLVIDVIEEKEKLEEKILEIERIEKVVEHVTKKTKDGYAFEPKERLQSLKEKLKEIVSFSHRRTQEFIDKRSFLHFNPGHLEFYVKQNDIAIPYTISMDRDELRLHLEKVVNFINSYWEFADHKDREVLKRVFEAILFAFTSPFIYLIRKTVKKEKGDEKVAEIPIVLILGGLANTGKTKLLLFINKLLGNNFEVFNYRDIYTRSQRIIYDLFNTTNIFPILVDEIYDNFFKGEGERLIKSLTNTLTEPHPCFIGTSNVGFSAESQVIRRIYYLHFGSPFSEDRSLKQRSEKYFEERVGTVNDRLFRYFLREYLNRMTEEEFFRLEDPLYLSRKIFIDFFGMAGLSIPDFISPKPCGDYYKIGSIEWQAFYLTRKAEFKEMKDSEGHYLVIDLKSIYEAKDAEQLKNKLPPSVVKSSGTPLILYKDKFLHFIGQKEGFLRKFLSSF